jgi:hypothetical protein
MKHPISAAWFVWVGVVKVTLNNDTEAIAWLRRGLEANRNNSLAHFHLAAVLARLGGMKRREPRYKRDLYLIPGSPSAVFVPAMHGATIRLTFPDANVSVRACGWPGCPRVEVFSMAALDAWCVALSPPAAEPVFRFRVAEVLCCAA